MGLDAGYATAAIAKVLEDRHILGVTGYRNPTPPRDGMMRKSKFVFDHDADGYSGYRPYLTGCFPGIRRECAGSNHMRIQNLKNPSY